MKYRHFRLKVNPSSQQQPQRIDAQPFEQPTSVPTSAGKGGASEIHVLDTTTIANTADTSNERNQNELVFVRCDDGSVRSGCYVNGQLVLSDNTVETVESYTATNNAANNDVEQQMDLSEIVLTMAATINALKDEVQKLQYEVAVNRSEIVLNRTTMTTQVLAAVNELRSIITTGPSSVHKSSDGGAVCANKIDSFELIDSVDMADTLEKLLGDDADYADRLVRAYTIYFFCRISAVICPHLFVSFTRWNTFAMKLRLLKNRN